MVNYLQKNGDLNITNKIKMDKYFLYKLHQNSILPKMGKLPNGKEPLS